MGVASIENFVRNRNDNFNFRDDICNLVIPGSIKQSVREKFEDIANAYGMLLCTDLDDETSFKNIERQFLPGGKYEFMKRPVDRAAADVVLAGVADDLRVAGGEGHRRERVGPIDARDVEADRRDTTRLFGLEERDRGHRRVGGVRGEFDEFGQAGLGGRVERHRFEHGEALGLAGARWR